MNRRSDRTEQDEQRLFERAAEWLNVLETAGPEERAEFMDWIGRSPRHLEEFLLASAVAHETGRIDLQHMPQVLNRLAAAPAAVAQLPVPEQREPEAMAYVSTMHAAPRRRWPIIVIGASVLAASVAAAVWLPNRAPHRLEFKTDTLSDIAAQFNRYNTSPRLVVIGEDIQSRHYSGMFDTNDPHSLIEYLRNDPELSLEQQGSNWVIRSRPAPP